LQLTILPFLDNLYSHLIKGTKVATKCPKCNSENPETSRFCGNCATQLTPAGQPPVALTKTLESPAYVLTKGSLVAGKYRITEMIGRGGMGVVYEAEDSKLARKVAIKVLPEIFAADLERLARFEREARVLASLSHPNIAAIYGVEEADGKRFLVLELVEGETLAERLGRGALSCEETLNVCGQISEGLEGAHEKNIVHRDLKPSNVKITPEGTVKILDFGLARAYHDQISDIDLAKSPTITADMTRPGVILGTAAYMSPEQAKGKPVDKRADIWAFGCVLFECLTGRRAFQGNTISETVAAILKGEPDWTLLPADTPGSVRSVLRRCLKKDPHVRLRDIADARVEMLEEISPSAVAIPAPPRFPLRWVLSISAATLVIGLLAGLMIMKFLGPATSPISKPVVRSVVRLEYGQWLSGLSLGPPFGFDRPTRTAMAVSSDGRFMVYASVKENPGPQNKSCLYLRRFDELEAKPIAGTEGGISPFLSPDDRWVGFWNEGKLMKVSIEGGVPAALCDVSMPFGFSWGDDHQIVFAPARGSGLSRIPAEGGKPETLTVPDGSKGEFAHRLPFCLPGSRGVLFTIMRHAWDKEPRVAVLELGTRKWHVLLEDAADARYIPTGHLAFLRRGTLMVVRFDLDKLEIIGQPVPAVAGIEQALSTTNSSRDAAAGQFAISGSLVYAPGGIYPDQENTLVLLDHTGKAEPIASFKAPFFAPRFSPDGRRVAYASMGMEGHIWILDLNRGTSSKLTSEGLSEQSVWTPDGRRVTFDLVNTGVPNIYWQPVDGSSPIEQLTRGECFQWPGSWTPDGETLAFVEDHADMEAGYDIQLLHIRDRKVTPFLNSRFDEKYPEISPDGRWIAYTSDESGRDEVYVQPFPGPGGKLQISNEGGVEPLWSRDGKELFYRQSYEQRENQAFVVDVQTGPVFSATKPRLLFTAQGYSGMGPIRTWDISPDGRRFLVVKMDERKSRPVTELVLVQNWFEEIKRLVPTGKK
jgi:serine/threonine protein kinase/Tol biopolymer transport system component